MTDKVKQISPAVSGGDEIDIGRLVGTVIEAKWWVLGITAAFAAAAIVYTLFATPIYSADALVRIEQNQGSALVQDISNALTSKPPASEAEIQMITSRLVLGKTVDDLDLDIAVSKNTFPILGAGWERLMGRQNETVKVTSFNRPVAMADSTFTLEVLSPTTYRLSNDDGFSVEGKVGEALNKDGVSLVVAGIAAHGGFIGTVDVSGEHVNSVAPTIGIFQVAAFQVRGFVEVGCRHLADLAVFFQRDRGAGRLTIRAGGQH